jgi:signal transduction histidine kinase
MEVRRNWTWRIVNINSELYLWRHLNGRRIPAEASNSRGTVIIQLNPQYLWRSMVRDLLDRAFLDRDQYEIAIVGSGPSGSRSVLFGSENVLRTAFRPDIRSPLLPEPVPPPGAGFPAARRIPQFFTFCGDTHEWELWVRHRAGSVGAEVRHFRVRNMILSGAVLLLLSSSIVLLVISNRRAHQLARQQMSFAAGISHELRTPLAVIRSAADNLAEGAITDPASVREHGSLIQAESRRLTTMVEDILSFAAARAGRQQVEMKPVEVNPVIQDALRSVAKSALESGIRLEEHVDADLPPVLADAHALSRCVQNLVTNAIKYAADGKWVGIYAMRNRNSEPPAVLIQICDRGPGIRSEDLPRIFEPFYQGSVKQGRKGGVGLGLSLTRSLMRAMCGDVSVNSSPGGGACFTLKVPLAGTHEQTTAAG